EAERAAPAHRVREADLVFRIDPCEVDRRLDAGCTAREHERTAKRQELRFFGRPAKPKIEREIAGAEREPFDARRGTSDGFGARESGAGLDQRQQLDGAQW